MSYLISKKWDSGDFHESKWNSSSGLSLCYYFGEVVYERFLLALPLFCIFFTCSDLFNTLYLLIAFSFDESPLNYFLPRDFYLITFLFKCDLFGVLLGVASLDLAGDLFCVVPALFFLLILYIGMSLSLRFKLQVLLVGFGALSVPPVIASLKDWFIFWPL